MRITRVAVSLICGLVPLTPAVCGTKADVDFLSGEWLAPAEDANDVDALVTLLPSAQTWTAHIKAIRLTRLDQPWRDESRCVRCSGTAAGQFFKGLQIVWGLHLIDGALQGGQILDPSDGRVYDCEIQPSADGKTLKVNAFRGVKWLGHTMVWTRP